ELERVNVRKRIMDILWELGDEHPSAARIRQMLGPGLDPLREPLGALKAVSREFFTSRGVYLDAKAKIYESLKEVEHLERLAQQRKLPLIPLLNGLDWGSFYQSADSFRNPALVKPAPRTLFGWGGPPPRYFSDPSLLPGI